MLPVVSGARVTRQQVFFYTLVLAALSVVPWGLQLTGAIYGVAAVALGGRFIVAAWHVLRDTQDASGISQTGDKPAKIAFKYSLSYLFLLFGALVADHLLR